MRSWTRREGALLLALMFTLGALVGRSSTAPLALASFLHGGIPDRQGLLHACYKINGGSLRLIDPSTGKCASDERRVVWHGGAASSAPKPAVTPATSTARFTFTARDGYVCSDAPGSTLMPPCVVASFPFKHTVLSMSVLLTAVGGIGVSNGLIANPPGISAEWEGGQLKIVLEPDPITHVIGLHRPPEMADSVYLFREAILSIGETVSVEVTYTS